MFLANEVVSITVEQMLMSVKGAGEWSNFERIKMTSVFESFNFSLFCVIQLMISLTVSSMEDMAEAASDFLKDR